MADFALPPVAGVCVSAAALLAAGLRPYLDANEGVRPRALALAAALWPVAVAGFLGLLGVAFAEGLRQEVQWFVPGAAWGWMIVGQMAAVVFGAAALGSAAGAILPRVLTPLTGVVVYLLMTTLPALEPSWVRFVAGHPVGCCAVDTQPMPSAVVLAVMTWLAVALAACGAVMLGTRVRRAVALVAGLTVVALVSLTASRGLHQPTMYTADESRATTPVCNGGNPRVCVWPEAGGELAHVQLLLAEATGRWRELGLNPVEAITVGAQPYRGAQPGFSHERGWDDAIVVYGATPVLAGLESPGCSAPGGGPPPVALFLTGAAGQDIRALPFVTDATTLVDSVLARPLAEQRAWLAEAITPGPCPR